MPRATRLPWLSFWAEGRDNHGCPGDTTASSTGSGISQSGGAFTQAFQAFTSGSGGGGGATPTPTAPTPAPPSGSCATAWVSNIACTAGNEVSYGGDDWTATQWNYDEAPGGPAGAWASDGSC